MSLSGAVLIVMEMAYGSIRNILKLNFSSVWSVWQKDIRTIRESLAWILEIRSEDQTWGHRLGVMDRRLIGGRQLKPWEIAFWLLHRIGSSLLEESIINLILKELYNIRCD